ncbi:transmembrane protein 234 isoform X3 [Brienomyrus brachyistius]|uniref:transmembrane protein 234 isoform X3 n=1 Tax=Brienomyrus brachyistius TaxID=42636 RepID=UPI0020B1E3B2|nr:transmembrane protein 234 isoform X3 [Brienomyrus brachyistius]
MVSLTEVLSLLLVALLWGATNPFLKKGAEGIEDVRGGRMVFQLIAEVKFLFINIRYLVPFLLNQSGSLVYYLTLATTGKLLGEEVGGKGALLGMFLTMLGVTLCVTSSIRESNTAG